jgi:ABC-type Mn2+/Zn2+ transport system ATPase subunit
MNGWITTQIIFGYLLVSFLSILVGYFIGKEIVENKLKEIAKINNEVKVENERQERIKQLSGGQGCNKIITVE